MFQEWNREMKVLGVYTLIWWAIFILLALPFAISALGCVITTRSDSGVGVRAGWSAEIYQRGPDEGADIEVDLHSWIQELIQEARDESEDEGRPDPIQ